MGARLKLRGACERPPEFPFVAQAATAGLRRSRLTAPSTKTKNTGTKKIARIVAEIIPPITPVPMAFWLAA